MICERDDTCIRYIKNILFHLKHRFQATFLKKEHHYWWRHIAVMLFLPPQTTKYCAHWWCHGQKNLATCYSKQVLVPIYCSKKPNAFNIFFILFFTFLFFFFPLSSPISLPLLPSQIHKPYQISLSHPSLPSFVDPSPKPPISLLSLL